MYSTAENPGNVKMSYRKFYQIRKWINHSFSEKFYYDMQMNKVALCLQNGDTQPAVVCSTCPLLVAAYSDEMDGVVILSFPDELTDLYQLRKGSRLTTSNVYMYSQNGECARDIFPGVHASRQYTDFMPIVQLFLGKNEKKIKANEEYFSTDVWEKAERLGNEYLQDHPGLIRNGFFYLQKGGM